MKKVREIIFRGKRVDNGEWVYGSLSMEYFDECGCVMISPTSDICYKVDPQTVGQFTGLINIDREKVYEGDILQFVAYGIHYTGKVEFLNGAFWVKCRFPERIGAVVREYKARVVGNVYDNPKLLEVRQ